MPDVLIIDTDMPELEGVAAIKALRSVPGSDRTAVIFCATESDPEFITAALEAGGDEYIMKPFDSEIVRSKFLWLDLLG